MNPKHTNISNPRINPFYLYNSLSQKLSDWLLVAKAWFKSFGASLDFQTPYWNKNVNTQNKISMLFFTCFWEWPLLTSSAIWVKKMLNYFVLFKSLWRKFSIPFTLLKVIRQTLSVSEITKKLFSDTFNSIHNIFISLGVRPYPYDFWSRWKRL